MHPLALLLAMLCTHAGAQAPGDEVTADQCRSAFVYSVYDPLYGRPRPAVPMGVNAADGPLVLDGTTYRQGFGCRLFSIVELQAPADAKAISAVVGIDDQQSQASGDTYFSVWAGGRCLWRSPAVSQADAAIAVTVPLGEAREAKLVTDSQGYGNTDLADWCDVRWTADGPAEPRWQWLPGADSLIVRPELHPCHLLYDDEDLPVTAISSRPGPVALTITLTDETGQPILQRDLQAELAHDGQGTCVAKALVPTRDLPNGLYEGTLTASAAGQPSASRPLRFGIIASQIGKTAPGALFGVNHHEFSSSYEALAAAGVRYSRQWFCWDWIESENDRWSFNWHDERMASAREAGIETIGVLGGIGCPAWSSPDNVEAGQSTVHGYPADLAQWEQYVRTVATRYKGQVKVWESWNEIAGPAEGGRQGWSVEGYVKLHRLTYQILKEVDPENRVLLCADTLTFAGKCLQAGLGDAFDGIVIHPYRPSVSPERGIGNAQVGNTGDVSSVFAASRRWLEDHGRPDAEIWATEIGWAVTGQDWPTVSEETHARYLPRTYLLALSSGAAANVCWHDFGLGMFGICNGQGYPRKAILAYAAMAGRLGGAEVEYRGALGSGLQTARLSRYHRPVLALWCEEDTAFARVVPPGETTVESYDWLGNRSELALPLAGRVLPVGGRIVYFEGDGIDRTEPIPELPFRLTVAETQVRAGHEAALSLRVANVFGQPQAFSVSVSGAEGLQPGAVPDVHLADGERSDVPLPLTADRDARPGVREVPVRVTAPDGLDVRLQGAVRVTPPLALTVEPFDTRALGIGPVRLRVGVRNDDDRPIEGSVEFRAPEGLAVTPARLPLSALAPGATATVSAELATARPIRADDSLQVVVSCDDSARAEVGRSLAPTILDADGNGLADGWRINPETTSDDAPGNVARVSIEPGDSEFHCQRIDCLRFMSGWIIFHRDGADVIAKNNTYRITFRARQQGLKSTVGVAVYNIQPWECCGVEKQLRVGPDWETYTAEFRATRGSDRARFELFFTETGTLWVENIRLEQVMP